MKNKRFLNFLMPTLMLVSGASISRADDLKDPKITCEKAIRGKIEQITGLAGKLVSGTLAPQDLYSSQTDIFEWAESAPTNQKLTLSRSLLENIKKFLDNHKNGLSARKLLDPSDESLFKIMVYLRLIDRVKWSFNIPEKTTLTPASYLSAAQVRHHQNEKELYKSFQFFLAKQLAPYDFEKGFNGNLNNEKIARVYIDIQIFSAQTLLRSYPLSTSPNIEVLKILVKSLMAISIDIDSVDLETTKTKYNLILTLLKSTSKMIHTLQTYRSTGNMSELETTFGEAEEKMNLWISGGKNNDPKKIYLYRDIIKQAKQILELHE